MSTIVCKKSKKETHPLSVNDSMTLLIARCMRVAISILCYNSWWLGHGSQ